MAKATPEQTKRARKAAAITALAVVAFASCFAWLMMGLDSIATMRQEQEVTIADEALSEPFYVLLIGSDTRRGTALYTGKATEHAQIDQHSDVMTLMRVDPQNYTISLLTIPRDTVLSADGEKINGALLEDDPSQVIDAVEEVVGLRPDYYMLTTFGLFADLIDAIGGITMDVAFDVTIDDPSTGGKITVEAGTSQKLNGSQALALARMRSEYSEDQDAMRQIYVRNIEEAIIERMLEGDNIGIERLLVVLEQDVRTDMDLSVLGLTVLEFIEHANDVTMIAGTGPYGGSVRDDDGQWVVSYDSSTWKKIMRVFTRGDDFSKIVKAPEIEMAAPKESTDSSKSSASKSSNRKGESSSASAKKKS